jgi:hypothetical protein
MNAFQRQTLALDSKNQALAVTEMSKEALMQQGDLVDKDHLLKKVLGIVGDSSGKTGFSIGKQIDIIYDQKSHLGDFRYAMKAKYEYILRLYKK